MRIFGLRVPFTRKRRLSGAARASRRRRVGRRVRRYAKRGAIAGGTGLFYVTMRGRRTKFLRR